jgi:hypothetical protein
MAAAMVAALLGTGAAAPLPGAQVLDRVIAVVSGSVITLSDARAALTLGLFDPGGARDPIEAAMRWLIDRQIVLDETRRGDRPDIDPAGLAAALDRVRQRFPSDAEYRRALTELGLDDAELERLVRDTLIARLYVDRRFESVLPPSEEELRAYYAGHADRFMRNGRQVSFEDALADATAMLQQERRDQAVSGWMERLQKRAEIREVYQSSR